MEVITSTAIAIYFGKWIKKCYSDKSHHAVATGACGLYWNQMLCERLDGRTRILLKKQGVYDIMSVSEPEACLHGYGERRMSIMIAAKAASSTEGANHDILNLSFAMQVQMKMLACGNHDNFTRKYNSY